MATSKYLCVTFSAVSCLRGPCSRFHVGVGSVVCMNPFSEGRVGLAQGGSGLELRDTRSDETPEIPWLST